MAVTITVEKLNESRNRWLYKTIFFALARTDLVNLRCWAGRSADASSPGVTPNFAKCAAGRGWLMR